MTPGQGDWSWSRVSGQSTEAADALAFLCWLDQHDVPLADVTQPLVDQWLLDGTSTRRVLGAFLS